jgi:hypothetical protein
MTTLDLTVANTNGDAEEYGDGQFNVNDWSVNAQSYNDISSEYYECSGFWWDGVTIPQGATINVAYISVWPYSGDDPNLDIYCNNVDNAANFSTSASIIARARTTASSAWVANNIGTGAYRNSPSIVGAVQEVINRASWVSGNAIAVLLIAKTNTDWKEIAASNIEWSHPAKLHIEYTAAAAAFVFKVEENPLLRM